MSCVVWLMLALAGPPARGAESPGLVARTEALLRAADVDGDSAVQQARRVGAAYRGQFPDDVVLGIIGQGDASQRRELFEATRIAAFYAPDADIVMQLRRAHDAMESRGELLPEHRRQMFEAYVSARRFDEAAEVHRRLPEAGSRDWVRVRLPPPAAENGPLAWSFDAQRREISASPLDLSQRVRIVVVASAGCPKCAHAARDIAADRELDRTFSHHATWLADPRDLTGLESVAAWNRMHPGAPLWIADRRDDWPWIRRWLFPAFYFLREGEVVAQVVGWPPEGRRAELIDAARRVGLVPAAKTELNAR